jgi:hypothetical protein
MFDETFNFQDRFIQQAFPTETNLQFEPERRIFLQATINF